MKLKLFIILISLSFSDNSLSFKDRFETPFFIRCGITAGYNDNIFKFSNEEKNDFDSYNYMGSSLNYDSSIIKPELRILYSPYIFKNPTNFIFYTNVSNYGNVQDKSGQYYSLRFEYKNGPYNWFKIGYRFSPDNFLRYYVDDDIPEENYVKCNYASETIYLNYSLNFNRYSWGRIELSQSKQFLNPSFTEFDLNISGITFKYYYRYKPYNFNIRLSHFSADNISYMNGLNSTSFDRSYNETQLKVSAKRKLEFLFKHLILGYENRKRLYISESEQDPLHSGRDHLEHIFSLSMMKELRYDMNIELKYRFRYRETNSDFDWVEELKSFSDNEILMKFTYDMDLDLFY